MPLIAYDNAGNIVTVLDFLVVPDADGEPGLVDLEEAERSGLKLRQLWEVSGAAGSTHWPEHLGERYHEFRVERDRRFSLPARRLVHRGSGHVRHRADIEAAVQATRKQHEGRPRRHVAEALTAVLGHPFEPLHLDDGGRTAERQRHPEARPTIPVRRRRDDGE